MKKLQTNFYFRKYHILCILIALLPACNSGLTTPSTGNPSQMGKPSTVAASDTSDPTRTSTMTLTPTITETPTITMTPTPPPDLELVNYTLIGNIFDINAPDRGWNLLGEIRNNTDQSMILFAYDPAFKFYIDDWRDVGHLIWGPISVEPSSSDNKLINCILYPGETGVISTGLYGACDAKTGCSYTTPDPSDTVQGEVIKLRSYESRYKRWDDIKENFPPSWTPLFTGFHPKAENVSYNLTQDGMIHVSFDINVVFPNTRSYFTPDSWIILYDRNNRIINMLYNILFLSNGYLTSGEYHVDGIGMDKYCITDNPGNQCWTSRLRMTPENLQKLDHIRVLVEMEDAHICQDGFAS